MFLGPVEVDKTFVGGRARNKNAERKRRLKKVPVIGILDRRTNQVVASPIRARIDEAMQGFIYYHTKGDTEVYTDETSGYRGLFRKHQTINHSAGEYGLTNGIESFWAIIKRLYMGVYHNMTPSICTGIRLSFRNGTTGDGSTQWRGWNLSSLMERARD